MTKTDAPLTKPGLTGRKANLVVLFLGLLPFFLLEFVLWIVGYQSHAYYENTAPHLQVFRTVGEQVVLTPERDRQFRTRPFAAVKPPAAIRIVTVGDSVTAGFVRLSDGRDAYLDRSYPEILESLLASNYPGRAIEVINCGGSGYGTYRLKDVVPEVLRYSPDLVTIMAGSSEFLEARHFKDWVGIRAVMGRRGLLHWKTLALARDLLRHAAARRVDTKQSRPILDANAASLPWMEQDLVKNADEISAVVAHSARNVTDMVRACKAAGVPVILCTSASNLRFNTLSGTLSKDGERLVRQQQELERSRNYAEIVRLLEPELPIYRNDHRCGSLIYYLAAEAYSLTGDYGRAYDCYVKAKDLDPTILRPLSAFNDMMRKIAREEQVPLLDVEAACRKAVPDGIPDDRVFSDWCHFLPVGHEFVARVFLDAVRAQLFEDR